MFRTSSATEVSSLWNLSLFCCHYFNLDYQVTMVLNSPLLFVKIVVKLSQTTIMVSMSLIQHQIRFKLRLVTRRLMEEVSICIQDLQNPVMLLLQLQVQGHPERLSTTYITLEIIFQNLVSSPVPRLSLMEERWRSANQAWSRRGFAGVVIPDRL